MAQMALFNNSKGYRSNFSGTNLAQMAQMIFKSAKSAKKVPLKNLLKPLPIKGSAKSAKNDNIF
jgi:hypothetical protein